MNRGLGEFFGQLRGFDIVLRQLVGAVEDVGQSELGVGGQHVGLQMNPQRLHLGRCNGARGNLEARPGQQRHGDHHRIEAVVGFGAARFGAGFDHVGQFVVGARAPGVQLVEYRYQRFLPVVGQQAVYVSCQAGFPTGVLNPVR